MRDLTLGSLQLVPDDRDPQTIFDNALARAKELNPSYQPRNGSADALLIEAFSLAAADVIYALNRVPPVLVEAVLGLFDVPRDAGAPATATVTLTFDSATTAVIPAGSVFTVPATGDDLVTTADVTVTTATTATLPVAAVVPGAALNGLAVGTSLDIIDAIPRAVTATIATTAAGGRDAEEDAAYLDRASMVLARVTSSLVVADHFTAYCLGDVRVGRALTVDVYDPTDATSSVPGDDLGHVTVYLYGRGAPLAGGVLTDLETQMQTRSSSILTVHAVAAALTTIAVTATVVAIPGYVASEVQARVVAAVAGFLSPDSAAWNTTVTRAGIIAAIEAVEGVDYVDALTAPSADVPLTGPGSLPKAGAITVSVS